MAVVAGYYFGFHEEKKAELVNLQGQTEELQRKLNKVRVIASNLEEFQLEVAKLERDLQLVVKQLPTRKHFEDLLRDISTAGKKVGVSIKSIERTDEIPHNFYAEVPFKLEIEGEYQQSTDRRQPDRIHGPSQMRATSSVALAAPRPRRATREGTSLSPGAPRSGASSDTTERRSI